MYTRAHATGVGANLARAFSAALFLYFTIYLIRPILLNGWSEAPGHGLKAMLDWTNNVSVRYGNFYYNPFHMLSIFFLLGSTMLLGMHGASIVATSPYGSELEIERDADRRAGYAPRAAVLALDDGLQRRTRRHPLLGLVDSPSYA